VCHAAPFDGYSSPTPQSIADCLGGNTDYQDGESHIGILSLGFDLSITIYSLVPRIYFVGKTYISAKTTQTRENLI
jgi:hypothetical protein